MNDKLKFALGGLLFGGSGAALAALLQSIKEEERKSKLYNNTSFDDSIIYVKDKQKNTKKASGYITEGSNIATLLGSSGVGYYLVRKALHNRRLKRLQEELDKSQEVYYEEILLDKSASDRRLLRLAELDDSSREKAIDPKTRNIRLGVPSPKESPVGWALGALGLLSMATMYATPKLLGRYRPKPELPEFKPTKRIVKIKDDEGEDDDELEKNSSFVTPDEYELCLRTLCGDVKRANASGFAGLVNHVANGNIQDIRDAIEHGGISSMFSVIEKAEQNNSIEKKAYAYKLISEDPLVSEALRPLIGAELYDMSPALVKVASENIHDYEEGLLPFVKFAMSEIRKADMPDLHRICSDVNTDNITKTSSYLQKAEIIKTLEQLLQN